MTQLPVCSHLELNAHLGWLEKQPAQLLGEEQKHIIGSILTKSHLSVRHSSRVYLTFAQTKSHWLSYTRDPCLPTATRPADILPTFVVSPAVLLINSTRKLGFLQDVTHAFSKTRISNQPRSMSEVSAANLLIFLEIVARSYVSEAGRKCRFVSSALFYSGNQRLGAWMASVCLKLPILRALAR